MVQPRLDPTDAPSQVTTPGENRRSVNLMDEIKRGSFEDEAVSTAEHKGETNTFDQLTLSFDVFAGSLDSAHFGRGGGADG